MMFTFLAAEGHKVGSSLLEQDQLERVKGYIATAKERGVELVLPVDAVVAASFAADAEHVVAPASAIEDTAFGASGLGLDIGPETAAQFAEAISDSKTVFWNGPMGVFEMAAFAAGTKKVAEALTKIDGLSVVGGGDSAAAVRQLGFADDQFGHISTGGGASLEFLEGKKLPGLEVLGWQLATQNTAHRRQLEDEPRPPAGGRVRPEAALGAEGCEARRTVRSRWRSSRRSPTCGRCRR